MKTISVRFLNMYGEHIKNILRKHYTIVESGYPDFVFYGFSNNQFMDYLSDAINIFVTGENIVPDFNYCDYAIGTLNLSFDNRYFRIPSSFLMVPPEKLLNRPFYDKKFINRRFCNFIYSNTTQGEGVKIREDFCRRLSTYKRVDCPGLSCNNMSNAIISRHANYYIESKLQFIKNYKFTIAFENGFNSGYSTEKLTQPLLCGSVPIYYGDPHIANDFNKNSFIDCRDFANWDAAIERIVYYDTHDEAYLKILNTDPLLPSFNAGRYHQDFEKWLLDLIENGSKRADSMSRQLAPPHALNNLLIDHFASLLLQPLMNPDGGDARTLIKELVGDKYRPFGSWKDHTPQVLAPYVTRLNKCLFLPWLLNQYSQIFKDSMSLTPHRLNMLQCVAEAAGSRGHTRWIKWLDDTDRQSEYGLLMRMLWPHIPCGSRLFRLTSPHGFSLVLAGQTVKSILIVQQADNLPKTGENVPANEKWHMRTSANSEVELNVKICQLPFSAISTDQDNLDDASANLVSPKEDGADLLILSLSKADAENGCLFEKIHFAKFSQIHLVFTGLTDPSGMRRFRDIIETISMTHVIVHIHLKNNSDILLCEDFILSDSLEVSFVKREPDSFTLSDLPYPLELDIPADSDLPEFYLGAFRQFAPITPPLAFNKRKVAFDSGLKQCVDWLTRRNMGGYSPFLELCMDFENADVDCILRKSGSEYVSRASFTDLDKFTSNGYAAFLGKNIGTVEQGTTMAGVLHIMDQLKFLLGPDGILFMFLPIGADCLVMSRFRIYGPETLPALFHGWSVLASFACPASAFHKPYGEFHMSLFILSPDPLALGIPSSASVAQCGQIRAISRSGLFDRDFYMKKYPDVLTAKIDTISHYVLFGASEGRNPSAWFNTRLYMANHPELDDKNINPLFHYLENSTGCIGENRQ